MSLDADLILNELVSHAAKLGELERIAMHEPKNAPGDGLSWVIFFSRLDPIASSGLNTTSVRLEFIARFYEPMRTEPQDEIDPQILRAVSALFAAYHGDFELSGRARHIDLLPGAYGAPLSAVSGYLEQDRVMFRIVDVIVPVIVNDVWTQEA